MFRSVLFQAVLPFVFLSLASSLSTVTFVYNLGPPYSAVANNQRVHSTHNGSIIFAGINQPGKTNTDVLDVQFISGDIPSTIPQVFDVFPNVETMTYSNNGLFHLKSGAFAKATKLRVLTIRFNFLPILHGHPFKGATALTTIQLTSDKIHSIEKSVFSDLTSLTFISLDTNHIKHLPSDVFDGLPALVQVVLTNNECPNQTFQKTPAGVNVALSTLSTVIQACPSH